MDKGASTKDLSTSQLVLDIFRRSCGAAFGDNDFKDKLALIKQLFKARDFLAIFRNASLLEVYTAEYAPSRSLCYRSLFIQIQELADVLAVDECIVFCMGAGNGAEFVGIAAAHAELGITSKLSLHSQDLADYSLVLNALSSNLTAAMPKSYITHSQSVYDLLDPAHTTLLHTHISSSTLTTAFFLLNELLATSKAQFVTLVSKITESMQVGSLLLIIDSAGSFSELAIAGKTYMCYQLMDHMNCFDCVYKNDSEWFRHPQGLHYPLKLNNMRYFVRLYRKV